MLVSGRYELVDRIGAGGMATVWRARDTVLGREVAVKVVDLAVVDDPALGERLQREAVAAASITHPDVVTVHDAGVADGVAYVVMTLVEGRDLAAVLAEKGPLPVADAARLGTRLAGALAAAHAAGVVHRDVKPANVLLHGDDVTLVDFGIASVDTAQAALTATGTVIGTAHAMSPEQARGEQATAASDVYGLGCLLTSALTGAPPFEAEVAVAVLQRHLEDDPPSLRARRPEVPADVDRLVLAMLAKDPAARPSAADVRDRLAAAAAAGTADDAATTVLPPPAAAAAADDPVTSTRVLPAAGGAALGAGAVGAGATPPATVPPATVPPASRPAAAPSGGTRPARAGSGRSGSRGGSRRGGSAWALPVGLGAMAIVLVGVLAFALAGGGPPASSDPTGPAAAPEAEAEASQPEAESAPDAGPEAAPDAEEAAPEEAAPEEAGEAPSGAADVLAGLEEGDREDLADQWREVVTALEEDKARKAGDRLRKLLEEVDELEEDGALSPEDADVLREAFVAGAPGAQMRGGDRDD
ncbi:MAG: serine/threonine protein kinase [Actinotalea sp.]|nr:serine/threonine protein kinase [Actinotalea sp.]